MTDTSVDTERYLVRNQAKCLGCGDVIVSRHTHDYVTCSCGALSVDGGTSYTRRAFDQSVAWEEMSIYSENSPSLERHQLENSTVFLANTHRVGACYGEDCTIHAMSNHLMRKYEQVWSEGKMWRKCEHGGLHPDPDDFPRPREGAIDHACCVEKCCAGAYIKA